MRVRWQRTTELPGKRSLDAKYGLVPLDPVRGFLNPVRRNFAHKLLIETSGSNNILEQLCGEVNDWELHAFYVS